MHIAHVWQAWKKHTPIFLPSCLLTKLIHRLEKILLVSHTVLMGCIIIIISSVNKVDYALICKTDFTTPQKRMKIIGNDAASPLIVLALVCRIRNLQMRN